MRRRTARASGRSLDRGCDESSGSDTLTSQASPATPAQASSPDAIGVAALLRAAAAAIEAGDLALGDELQERARRARGLPPALRVVGAGSS
jgi:hypothetical protein